jgi:phage FluMu protein Com
MGKFDFFVGALKCPICGTISKSDSSTNMQTKIRENMTFEELGVGHTLEINEESLFGAGYSLFNQPDIGEDVVLIDVWECKNCNRGGRNWAKIVVRDGIINEVSAFPVSKNVVNEANYIVDECLYDLQELEKIDHS